MLAELAITAACLLIPQPIAVNQHNAVWGHAHDAVIHRHQPELLTIDRPDAALHRSQSLKGIPTRPGYDRDEYPPAVAAEGGTGADIRYVKSSINRQQGALLGRQLAPFCNGQHFILANY